MEKKHPICFSTCVFVFLVKKKTNNRVWCFCSLKIGRFRRSSRQKRDLGGRFRPRTINPCRASGALLLRPSWMLHPVQPRTEMEKKKQTKLSGEICTKKHDQLESSNWGGLLIFLWHYNMGVVWYFQKHMMLVLSYPSIVAAQHFLGSGGIHDEEVPQLIDSWDITWFTWQVFEHLSQLTGGLNIYLIKMIPSLKPT